MQTKMKLKVMATAERIRIPKKLENALLNALIFCAKVDPGRKDSEILQTATYC